MDARDGVTRQRCKRYGQHLPKRSATASALPALRPLAPSRHPLCRGRFRPLRSAERRVAFTLALREVQAESSRGPKASKLRTIKRYLECFGLTRVVYSQSGTRLGGGTQMDTRTNHDTSLTHRFHG